MHDGLRDTHPELVTGAAAKMPPSKRKTRIDAVFRDRAFPTCVRMKTANVPTNTGFRPYCESMSDS